MLRSTLLRGLVIIGMALLITGCESAKERAQKHLQAALALIEKGDDARAIVEFRNVFKLDKNNLDARRAYAKLLRDMGQSDGALKQYLRLVEQAPDDLPGNIAVAQIAIERGAWKEVKRYGEKALKLAPDNPASKVIALNLQYLDAVKKKDDSARRDAARAVQARLESGPDDLSLRRIMIDSDTRDGNPEAALAQVAAGLKLAPDDRRLWNTRLQLLVHLQRYGDVEAQLKEMLTKFPDDAALKEAMVRFYLSRKEGDKAEAFLRGLVGKTTGDERLGYETALVRLVLATRGNEAAIAEVDALIKGGGDGLTLGALRAGLRFEAGNHDAAIAEMQALIDGAQPSDQRRRTMVALAKMQSTTGHSAEAQSLVEKVLAADPGQTDAMKMKAAWLIQEDKVDDAIALLRTVLDQSPGDVEALMLSAQAHDRAGDHDLARNFLSLAVNASKSAPDPSLRYARVLMQDKRYGPAEDVLVKALRLAPNNLALMNQLGQLYVLMKDWPRAEQVERTLRGFADPNGAKAADALKVRRLAAQGDTQQSLSVLEGLASGDGGLAAQVAVVRARLATGDGAGALSYAEELLSKTPDDPRLQFLVAAVEEATGDLEKAAKTFRDILDKTPQMAQAWMGLIRTLTANGDMAGAQAAVDQGLKVLPNAPDLLWVKAGFLEEAGKIQDAIALNEKLYELAPNSLVAANNLASLLSTYRDDDTSLEKAWQVARRLKDTEVPAFQDTYGWIAYRRGDAKQALPYLEGAAKVLTTDPLVQLHLGLVYLKLDRKPEALARLRRAVDVAGPGDSRPQIAQARDEVAKLEAAGVTVPADPAPAQTLDPSPGGGGGTAQPAAGADGGN